MTGPTLVTGAAGFAGSHLVDLLSADRNDLIAWRRPGSRPRGDSRRVQWQEVDLLDDHAVSRAIAEVRPAVAYHCAAAAHVGQSWGTTAETLRLNVMGTHHLVEALRAHAPAASLLIVSSASVYGPGDEPIDELRPLLPASPYGLSKLSQEMVACDDNDGSPVTFVARPFNHFGPGQASSFVSAAFARQIAEIEAGLLPPVIRVGNLKARRDLTDVRDTVRAYRAIVERGIPGRPYNVCSGRAVSVQDVLDLLVSLARVPVTVEIDSARFRPNDTPVVLGCPTRIQAELGWSAVIPLSETASDLLEYWRRRIATP
jgi:GDP-4-dehydro-6-deoxy-D-mannose reductase